MSFLKKVKSGASDLGKRAQTTVEINRFKAQIAMKQKEIDSKYTEIGKMVYTANENNIYHNAKADVQSLCAEIHQLNEEIDNIQKKIRHAKTETTED
ncbi:hypothetical protein [Desertibacillus haloalkaliphilus]|uniref:hypothetical protein n=1 Tax=Desertibacillus haloalkaliphilus TaxID=1328930 RepID=UPI001C266CFC|nr:hypothetical protein [Desertibacillus haloalkaliphilus]MBU8908105.1 hypothetical protein [Desertibacillus haloalkaliphilus]